MCTLAPHACAALSFGPATCALPSLERRRRGVAAACGGMARDTSARRAGAVVVPSALAYQKRALSGFDVKKGPSAAVPAPAPLPRLAERMGVELDAVRDLYEKAKLLFLGPAAPMAAAAKRRMMSPSDSEPPSKAARQSREPEKKRQLPAKRAAPPPTNRSIGDHIDEAMEARKRRRLEEIADRRRAMPPPRKRTVTEAIAKAEEVQKRRRLEEIARMREKARQEVLEMERAALLDETIDRRDLEELGLTAFEYVVTPTRKQARRGGG